MVMKSYGKQVLCLKDKVDGAENKVGKKSGTIRIQGGAAAPMRLQRLKRKRRRFQAERKKMPLQ